MDKETKNLIKHFLQLWIFIGWFTIIMTALAFLVGLSGGYNY